MLRKPLKRKQTAHSEDQYTYEGFPSGPVDRNLPANAGDTGSVPGLGRAGQQSLRACMPQLLKPAHLRAWAPRQEKPHQGEFPAPHLESSPSSYN